MSQVDFNCDGMFSNGYEIIYIYPELPRGQLLKMDYGVEHVVKAGQRG